GETDNSFVAASGSPWMNGEIRPDLPTVVSGFSDLKYVMPFAPTGPFNDKAWVSIEGKVLSDANGNSLLDANGKKLVENGWEMTTPKRRAFHPFYSQEGLAEDLTRRNDSFTRQIAAYKAKKTCQALEALIISDPFRRQELQISSSGQVLVFLDVEPWTKLSAVYWNSWAQS